LYDWTNGGPCIVSETQFAATDAACIPSSFAVSNSLFEGYFADASCKTQVVESVGCQPPKIALKVRPKACGGQDVQRFSVGSLVWDGKTPDPVVYQNDGFCASDKASATQPLYVLGAAIPEGMYAKAEKRTAGSGRLRVDRFVDSGGRAVRHVAPVDLLGYVDVVVDPGKLPFFDQVRQAVCTPALDPQGKSRCFPVGMRQLDTTTFSDAACTMPLLPSTECQGQLVAVWARDTTGQLSSTRVERIYEVGATTQPSTVYTGESGTCAEDANFAAALAQKGVTVYALNPVALDSFPLLTETSE
jgi:hypothetical protein